MISNIEMEVHNIYFYLKKIWLNSDLIYMINYYFHNICPIKITIELIDFYWVYMNWLLSNMNIKS